MGCVICCELEAVQFTAAQMARDWLRAFYPDVTVLLDRESATLCSERHDEVGLGLIWRSALINEKLLTEGAAPRAAVIAALVE
jgi:hypothetical protein